MSQKLTIIFDLDGTLVDSKPDLCASINHVRQAYSLPPISEKEIGGLIGDGAGVLIQRVLEEKASRSNVKSGLEMFLCYYREHMLDETGLYDGVEDSLCSLGDCQLAVLTNKPYLFTCAMLEGLGIGQHFSVIYGGNSFARKKPDPVGVYRILSDTKSDIESAWIVGDSAVDVLTGRNAGITTCGVTYGYAADSFEDASPDFLIDTITELNELIKRQ